MAEFPALPIWTDAYISDTTHLSLEEHGAYLKLLMIAWRSRECAIPDDDNRIATMLGITVKKWKAMRPTIIQFWTEKDGKLFQHRLTKTRRAVAKSKEQKRAAAKARWGDKSLKNNATDDAAASSPHMQPQCNRNANHNHILKKNKYSFVGKIIRLTESDFRQWQESYHAIPDLRATLQGLDDHYDSELEGRDRKNWFTRCSAALANKHTKFLQANELASRPAPKLDPQDDNYEHDGATRKDWCDRMRVFYELEEWHDMWGTEPPEFQDTYLVEIRDAYLATRQQQPETQATSP